MRTREDIRNFWLVAVLAGAITAVGLGAAHYMELHGHIVTGMNNQVVWGLPHVFAIFMVVAASYRPAKARKRNLSWGTFHGKAAPTCQTRSQRRACDSRRGASHE